MSMGASLFPSGAFSGNEGEYFLRENRVLKAGYRLNVEAWVVLFKSVPERAVFRAPLDQEFFHPS
jgi:hypothetical protein